MKKPVPKVAVVGSRNLPGNYGGVETACENLYTRLAEKGFSVVAYCRSDGFKVEAIRFKGVSVFSFPVPNIPGFSTFLHCFIASVLATLSDADIIHFHAQGPALFSMIPKLFAPRKKIGFTCHGRDWQRARWSRIAKTVLKWGEVVSARFTDFRIMVSDDLKKAYQTEYGVDSVRLHNGVSAVRKVELERLPQRFDLEKNKYLLFVGRLVPEKSPHILIQAFNQVATDYKLAIVGDAPETPEYVSYLKDLAKDNPNIIFTSYLRGREIAEAYSNALAYVSSSSLEGNPITALEAMSYALPVLLSDIQPHQEILSLHAGETLPSFKADDIEACRAALEAACALAPEQLARIGENSRSTAQKHFDWNAVTEATQNIYLDATRSGRPAYLPAALGTAPMAEAVS